MNAGCPMIDCLRSSCLVKSKVSVCEVAPGQVSMMLCCVIVMNVTSTDQFRDAQGRVLWKDKTLPCMYLAHQELESVNNIYYY